MSPIISPSLNVEQQHFMVDDMRIAVSSRDKLRNATLLEIIWRTFFLNQRHHKTFNDVVVHWKLYLSQQGFSGTAKRVTCIATTKFMRGTNFSSFQFVSKLFPSIEIDSITDSMSITQFNMNTPFSLGYTSVRTRCTNGCKSVKNNTLWLNSLSG